jgi:hypothetical protein
MLGKMRRSSLQVAAMPKIDRDGFETHGEINIESSPVLWEHHELALQNLRCHVVDALPQNATKGRACSVVTRPAFTTSALVVVAVAACLAPLEPASAQPLDPAGVTRAPRFTATLSNNTPLAIGMDVADTARALGTELRYISGHPGDEIYLAFRDQGGSGLFPQHHRLYLQFRSGRLTGWKGDWGHNEMWQ